MMADLDADYYSGSFSSVGRSVHQWLVSHFAHLIGAMNYSENNTSWTHTSWHSHSRQPTKKDMNQHGNMPERLVGALGTTAVCLMVGARF